MATRRILLGRVGAARVVASHKVSVLERSAAEILRVSLAFAPYRTASVVVCRPDV